MYKLNLKSLCLAAAISVSPLQMPLNAFAENYPDNDIAQDVISADDCFSDIQNIDLSDTSRSSSPDHSRIPVSEFFVSNLSPGIDTDLDYTEWWYSKWDDCRYIFLPSTADRNDLVINYTADDALCLNGIQVDSGSASSLLSENDTFRITVGDEDCGTLKIMQSDLGCVYISADSGSIDKLDGNRYFNETGSVLMLNSQGGVEYDGKIDKLSAHGNSSWDYSSKKSYNIKLEKKEDLYGMGKAKKWSLISNYLDPAMLRNKISEDMSKAADMQYPLDSVYVDLYTNGSYRGTYQIYEKIQIQKNRINITDLEEATEKLNDKDLKKYPQKVVGASSTEDYVENSYKYFDIPNDPDDITGGYILQFQQWNRYGGKAKSGFVTSRGQAIAVDDPEYASKAQVEYIRAFVQDLEDAIYSDTGYNDKGRHYSEYIDVDSLVKAYLIEEISENIDATYSSFYFWKDSDITGDGKIHFGPAWDYDLSYCNFYQTRVNSKGQRGYSSNPKNLFVTCFPIHGYDDGGLTSSSGSKRPTVGMSWLAKLYEDENFVKRVAEIYFEKFEPYLTNLVNNDDPYINKLAESIRSSAEMSCTRWHTYGKPAYSILVSASGDSFMDSVGKLSSFLVKRENWLSDLWLPETYLKGDINDDGEFSIADVLIFQKWLLNAPDVNLVHWQAADFYKNDKLDVFDLCIMKKELLHHN